MNEMKNVPYTDGSPSREWVEEAKQGLLERLGKGAFTFEIISGDSQITLEGAQKIAKDYKEAATAIRELRNGLKAMLPEDNLNDFDKGRPTFEKCETARDLLTKYQEALNKIECLETEKKVFVDCLNEKIIETIKQAKVIDVINTEINRVTNISDITHQTKELYRLPKLILSIIEEGK